MDAVSPVLKGEAVGESRLPSPSMIQMYKNIAAGFLSDQARIQAHKRILCELMCCCNTKADAYDAATAKTVADQGEVLADPKRQGCVENAIKARRTSTLENSIHREELTFNMQFSTPVPMMKYDYGLDRHSGYTGVSPTEPRLHSYGNQHLHYWDNFGEIQGRATREYDPLWRKIRASKGLPRYRRPDVVAMLQDVAVPYNQPYINWPHNPAGQVGRVLGQIDPVMHIFEMKFPGDTERRKQFEDYRVIAPGQFTVLDTTGRTGCRCRGGKRTASATAAVPFAEPLSNPFGEVDLTAPRTSPVPAPMPTPEPAPPSVPSPEPWSIPWPELPSPPSLPPLPFPGRLPKPRF